MMFKKVLCLLLLPSLSWGATCVVPAKQMEILGLWPQQPVSEFIAKQSSQVDKVFEDEYDSREGRLDFENRDRRITGIGEVFIGEVAFNVDSNQITSFTVLSMDSEGNLDTGFNKFMSKVKIPRHLWTKESGSYHYLCDDYEVVVEHDRQVTYLIMRSKASELYNKKEPEYFFTAKEFIGTKARKQMVLEDGMYSSHDLYANDPIFSKKLNEVVLKKLGLTIDDFHMGVGLGSENIRGSIITMQFWQDKLHMYVAYDADENKMLVVLRDANDNLKTYGDKNSWLTTALIKSDGFPLEWASRIK